MSSKGKLVRFNCRERVQEFRERFSDIKLKSEQRKEAFNKIQTGQSSELQRISQIKQEVTLLNQINHGPEDDLFDQAVFQNSLS